MDPFKAFTFGALLVATFWWIGEQVKAARKRIEDHEKERANRGPDYRVITHIENPFKPGTYTGPGYGIHGPGGTYVCERRTRMEIEEIVAELNAIPSFNLEARREAEQRAAAGNPRIDGPWRRDTQQDHPE